MRQPWVCLNSRDTHGLSFKEEKAKPVRRQHASAGVKRVSKLELMKTGSAAQDLLAPLGAPMLGAGRGCPIGVSRNA